MVQQVFPALLIARRRSVHRVTANLMNGHVRLRDTSTAALLVVVKLRVLKLDRRLADVVVLHSQLLNGMRLAAATATGRRGAVLRQGVRSLKDFLLRVHLVRAALVVPVQQLDTQR